MKNYYILYPSKFLLQHLTSMWRCFHGKTLQNVLVLLQTEQKISCLEQDHSESLEIL